MDATQTNADAKPKTDNDNNHNDNNNNRHDDDQTTTPIILAEQQRLPSTRRSTSGPRRSSSMARSIRRPASRRRSRLWPPSRSARPFSGDQVEVSFARSIFLISLLSFSPRLAGWLAGWLACLPCSLARSAITTMKRSVHFARFAVLPVVSARSSQTARIAGELTRLQRSRASAISSAQDNGWAQD